MTLTEKQAIALAESEWWKDLPARQVVGFQLFEDRLCMPFGEYQRLTEEALGRPVFTHEFAWPENLRAELQGEKARPSFSEILDLIPEEKRVLVVDTGGGAS